MNNLLMCKIEDDREINVQESFDKEFNNKSNLFAKYFSIFKKPTNVNEQTLSEQTLFSALVSKRITHHEKSLNLKDRNQPTEQLIRLDIPDLPDDSAFMLWQIPSSQSYEWIDYAQVAQKTQYLVPGSTANKPIAADSGISSDEGPHSDKCSPRVLTAVPNNQHSDDVWEVILQYRLSDYCDWDMMKNGAVLIKGLNDKNNNFSRCRLLIDSPAEIFDKFYYHYLTTISMLIDETRFFARNNAVRSGNHISRVKINLRRFLYDAHNLLIGLPSSSFTWEEDRFEFNGSVHVSGISSESLYSFSRAYTYSGTLYRRMLAFLALPQRDLTCGAIFRTFVVALNDYMRYINRFVIESLENQLEQMTLPSFDAKFAPIVQQFRFLCRICKLDDLKPRQNVLKYEIDYLKGIDLITYLFREAKLMVNESSNFCLILHLISKSLVPLFKFIENWAFKGIYFDPFDEFFIECHQKWLNYRDGNYIKRGYTLKEKFRLRRSSKDTNIDEKEDENDDKEKQPHESDEFYLLKHLYTDIFECGKNLAILRLCKPNHFLCNNVATSGEENKAGRSVNDIYQPYYRSSPKLVVNFNQSYLQEIDLICVAYYQSFLHSDKLISRAEYVSEQAKIYRDKVAKMKAEASVRFKEYEERLKTEKKVESDRKKVLLDSLKQQMEADLKRRLDEKIKQQQDDKEYMRKLVNREFELNEKQKQMEEELKRQITKEYEELMKKAEEREQIALDRISQANKILGNGNKSESNEESLVAAKTSTVNTVNSREELNKESILSSIEESTKTTDNTNVETEIESSEQKDQVLEELKPKMSANTETEQKPYRSSIRFVKEDANSPKVSHYNQTEEKTYRPSIRMVKPIESIDRVEKVSKRRSIKPVSPRGDLNRNLVKSELLIEEESEMEKEKRLRAASNLAFTREDTRVRQIDFESIVKPYSTDFDECFKADDVNSSLLKDGLIYDTSLRESTDSGKVENESENMDSALYSHNYLELEEMINRILYKPIRVQLELVNQSVISYFLFDLKLDAHLSAIREYMLFENGTFSQCLVDEVFASFSSRPSSYLSPAHLNDALNKAVSQVAKTSPHVVNLGIRIVPVSKQNDAETHVFIRNLDRIQLLYRVDWPLNIIISEECILNYNKIFGFLFKIKIVLQALNELWHVLKRHESTIKTELLRSQLKQFKIYCHEMQHYIFALQNYVYNQVIQVAWQELDKSLNDARSLNELIEAHLNYIKSSLVKCFFTKKAEQINNVIINMFSIILKFRSKLLNSYLVSIDVNNEQIGDDSSQFDELTKTYDDFKSNALFLHKILQKLVTVGQEVHLNNLALTLNYNGFYGVGN